MAAVTDVSCQRQVERMAIALYAAVTGHHAGMPSGAGDRDCVHPAAEEGLWCRGGGPGWRGSYSPVPVCYHTDSIRWMRLTLGYGVDKGRSHDCGGDRSALPQRRSHKRSWHKCQESIGACLAVISRGCAMQGT